jgi:phosphoglycerol transferase
MNNTEYKYIKSQSMPKQKNEIGKSIASHFKKHLADYVGLMIVVILSCAGIYHFFNLSKIDLNVPLSYSGGDSTLSLVQARLISETGGSIVNNSIGAPFGNNGYDFTANNMHNFDNIILKLCVWIFKEPAISVNIFYFSLFIMIGAISFFVMRQLKIRHLYAVLGSLTFVFMPFIFMRGINHLVLSAYQFVPLSILLCVWAYQEEDFLVINKNFFKNIKNIIAIISTILIANNGIAYYAFFTCLFLAIVMISKTIKAGKINAAIKPIILIGLICVFTAINAIPSYVYNLQNGANDIAVTRSTADAEIYGLKIAQLFLPVNGHGIPFLENSINTYNAKMPFVNENKTSYLGALGIVGFLSLLLFLFRKNKNKVASENISKLEILSEMNVFAVLFAVVGGFSSIFSLMVSEVIRGHNRISIFIAYICIIAVMIFLEEFTRKFNKKIIYVVVIAFCLFGIWEQRPPGITSDYPNISVVYKSDADFVQNIESQLPDRAMIYQMPYHKTPEAGPVNSMEDYQLYVGYIHSKTLRWSYGATKGRDGDKWFEAISNYPLEKRIETISLAGYSGIYIDRRAYTVEDMNALEKSIEDILGETPIYSENGVLEFFNMLDYNKRLKSSYSNDEYNKLSKEVFII